MWFFTGRGTESDFNENFHQSLCHLSSYLSIHLYIVFSIIYFLGQMQPICLKMFVILNYRMDL